MPSKMVLRQHSVTASIGAAALRLADPLAERLTERFAAQSQGAEPPAMDWKPMLISTGQYLVDTGASLVAKDEELNQLRRAERQLRFDRDEAAKQIRAQLRGLRFLVDEAFGKEKAKLVFPARADLQRIDATVLLGVAKEAVSILRGRDYQWPDLSALGHIATPAQILPPLEQAIPKLANALDGLLPEKRGAHHALGNKNRDYEATVEAMQRGADLIHGLFRFAGFDDEADRLVPRRRRKVKKEETPTSVFMRPEPLALRSPVLNLSGAPPEVTV